MVMGADKHSWAMSSIVHHPKSSALPVLIRMRFKVRFSYFPATCQAAYRFVCPTTAPPSNMTAASGQLCYISL